MSTPEKTGTRPSLRIAVYCVAIPFGLMIALFLLWLPIQIGQFSEAMDLDIWCTLLWALGFVLGAISVVVGAVVLAVQAWKGLHDESQSRRNVITRTLWTAGLIVAYFAVGWLMFLFIVRTILGPRIPSENIHQAVERKDPQIEEVMQFLEEDPEAVHVKDASGYTPLHYAARRCGWEELAVLLVARGAEVNATNNDGETPLHLAADNSAGTEQSRLLIAKGAAINATDNKGDTPLHIAARWARLGIVRLLIAKGADLNIRNLAGDTPLDAAIRQWTIQVDGARQRGDSGFTEDWERCIDLLKQHGAETNNFTWPQE